MTKIEICDHREDWSCGKCMACELFELKKELKKANDLIKAYVDSEND